MNEYLKSVEEAYKHLLSVYRAKNSDYGNSFEECCNRFGLVSAVVRMNDKINRVNSLYDKSDMKVNDSLVDTLLDLANYAVMTAVWMNNMNYNEEDVSCSHDSSYSRESSCSLGSSCSQDSSCSRNSSCCDTTEELGSSHNTSTSDKGCCSIDYDTALEILHFEYAPKSEFDYDVPLDDFKRACLLLNLMVGNIDEALVAAGIIDEDGKITPHAIIERYIRVDCHNCVLITARGKRRIIFDEDIVYQNIVFKVFK